MQKLIDYYTKSLLGLAGAVVAAALLVPTVIVPYLEKMLPTIHWSGKLASGLTSGTVVGLILAVGEWFIRTKLWKIWYPELDFSGKWTGYTKYTHVHIGKTKQPVPFATEQEVVIRQDCLSLRLVPSEGLDFKFKSRAINIQDDGAQLVYAYLVEYAAGIEDRPPEAYGYEWLDVVKTPEGKRSRVLNGKFGQCALGQKPVFSGEVHLFRDGIGYVVPEELKRPNTTLKDHRA